MNGVECTSGVPAPAVYRCPNCRAWLGATDGGALVIGAVRFVESVRAVCSHCGYRLRWRGGREPAGGKKA